MQFKSIRYRNHYAYVCVSGNGAVKAGKKALTGNTIAALLKDGEQLRMPFGGFMDAECHPYIQRVKLIGIDRLYEDMEGLGKHYYGIPRNHYLIGAYQHKQFFVLLYNGAPKHFELPEPKPKTLATVHRLKP